MFRTKPRSQPDDSPPVGRRHPVLMLLLMLLCGAGFWYNFERRFAAIEAEHSLKDSGHATPAERERILALRKALRETWGLGVRVHIQTEQLPAPTAPDGNTVLIHLVVPGNAMSPTATVFMPALVNKALKPTNPDGTSGADDSFSHRLETWLTVCLAEKTAGQCAQEALLRLLMALEGRPAPAAPAHSIRAPLVPSNP